MTSQSVSTVPPPSQVHAPTSPGAGFWASAAAVARRTVRKFVRTPQLIVLTTIQSALWLLIFRYIFGGAINVDGLSYVAFLVPGVVVTNTLFSGMGAAAGVAEDIEQGFFDRLRSLPIPRVAVMAGRGLADTALLTWGLAVATALGFAVGFRTHGSVAAGLTAFGLCVLYGFAFDWIFITIGLVGGTAQAAQGLSLLVLPLVFVSSAYVPVSSMPGWMQPFATHQPVTPMVDAVRALVGGPQAQALLEYGTAYYAVVSLIWSAAIIVVFGLLAAVRFSRR
jgi:ABC-2 type transport system permease protein